MDMWDKMILDIRHELQKNIDIKYKSDSYNFFKEEINPLGVRAPIVKKISAKYFSKISLLDKRNIFGLCESLLLNGYDEEKRIAFDWAYRIKKQYTKNDFKVFERWLKKYVSNWWLCDDLCTHAFGCFIFKFPEFLFNIKKWTKSKNRWLRRASAVILIYSNRKDRYINDAFEIANMLLDDNDYLVQKGYGWMLKEISNLYPQKVFKYVMSQRRNMPRTALRYSIEKLPIEMKQKI